MQIDPVIPAFLEVFNNNPQIFDEDLQDLDQTLTELENQPIDTISETLIDWYSDEQRFDKIGIFILETIQKYTDSFKEIKQVPPSQPNPEDIPIDNRSRELRKAVKERLEAQQQKSQKQP